MNLIEIGPVVIEIQGVENGEFAVPVNNILVHHTAFLAADTRPCVFIMLYTEDFSMHHFSMHHFSMSGFHKSGHI